MTFEGQQSSDLRATLALSQEEAQTGTTRTLTLPEGRQVTITIPAGVREGQEIRVEGQGQLSSYTGRRGDLILTMDIPSAGNSDNPPYTQYPQSGTDFPTELIAPPPPPTQASYSAGKSGPGYTIPAYGQPSYTQPGQYTLPPPPVQQQQQPRRRLSPGITILLVVLAVLLITGGGLIYYVTVYQPNKAHADATATVQAQVSGTANALATSTAQVLATARTEANATATVQSQATAQAQATVQALQNVYTQVTSGSPALNDPLSRQGVNSWDEGANCAFSNGAYHVTETQKDFFFYCVAQSTNFSNFAYQVKMDYVRGKSGGVVFRADGQNSKFYFFRIGSDGTYDLYVYVDRIGSHAKTLLHSSSSAISNSSNLVTVIARGSNIYLYVNKQYVNGVSDNTLSGGQIGVVADYVDTAADIAFSQAQVWTL